MDVPGAEDEFQQDAAHHEGPGLHDRDRIVLGQRSRQHVVDGDADGADDAGREGVRGNAHGMEVPMGHYEEDADDGEDEAQKFRQTGFRRIMTQVARRIMTGDRSWRMVPTPAVES